MGSSKPATQKTTTNQTTSNTPSPYAPATGAINDMLAQAQGAYAATPKTPTYTGLNAQQLQAQNILTGLAGSTGAGAASVADNAQKTASGYYLDPAHISGGGLNPYTSDQIAASINPLRQQLDANVLSIGDAAKLAGAYGGDRQDILKGQALTGFNQAALNTTANINYQAFNDQQQRLAASFQAERARQMDAAGQFSAANQLAMTPAQIIAALGDQTSQAETAANQSKLDAPWAGLDREAQVINSTAQPLQSSTGTQVGTSTTVGTPAQGSTAQGAISGALGGASAGAAFGPWGAGIGAVVGGLGGLFH